MSPTSNEPHASPYSGHVEPGGEWADRQDGDVFVRKVSVGPMDNNAYVVGCRRTGQAVLIDVPAEPERLRQAMDGWQVVAALLTHGHHDHVGAWEALRDDDALAVWAHPDDADLFPRPADRNLTDGDRLRVGEITVEVIAIPAHTEGSLLFAVEGDARWHLFSGDTLFPGGHGRTRTIENHHRIMDGLENKIFARFHDDTWVYPGHGDDTTLGVERPHLAEWRARGW